MINTTYRPFSMVFFYVFLKLSEKKYQLSRVRDWRHLSSNSALRKQLISQLSKVRRILQSKEMRKKEANILFHQRLLLYTLIEFTKNLPFHRHNCSPSIKTTRWILKCSTTQWTNTCDTLRVKCDLWLNAWHCCGGIMWKRLP